MEPPSAEIQAIRQAMETFIAGRLAEKLKGTRDEEKRQRLIEEHQPHHWIGKAAHLATQIQLVTHALKFTHPDARGTSLYSPGNPQAPKGLIGTHVVPQARPDVVGNAAAQAVARFLGLEVNGRTLWQRAAAGDPALSAALPATDDAEREAWMRAFAAVVEPKGPPASHRLARQVYWPLDGTSYHLLGPLFPSTLVQEVWRTLRDDRFSEQTRAAREARYKGRPHPRGYRDWPGLVSQRFGGTKPQNISRLNSERHGEIWLLPSHPPQWQDQGLKPPCHLENALHAFQRQRQTQRLLADLGRYLQRVKDWNNQRIRAGRAWRVEQIIDALLQYAAQIRALPPGWSADPECRLAEAQRFWLDPHRDDPALLQARAQSHWPQAVARDFATWLNARLHRYRLPMGDPEHRAWRQELEEALNEHLEEMEA